MSENSEIEILFGVVLIIIYAMERFNSPTTVRASTTAYRYYLAALLYLLIYLLSFYTFTKYPQLLKYLEIGEETRESTVIFVAMIFSLLVPKVPLISQLDERLRKYLHRLASIPFEAIRLSKAIKVLILKSLRPYGKMLLMSLKCKGFLMEVPCLIHRNRWCMDG